MTDLPWARLLRNLRTKPSFSYVVGALQKPIGAKFDSKEDAEKFARKLHDDMVKNPPFGFKVVSHECDPDKVGALVIYLDPDTSQLPLSPFGSFWDPYEDGIVDGKYSRVRGKPEFFTDEEKQTIREALSAE